MAAETQEKANETPAKKAGIRRIKTHIEDYDQHLDGGIPVGHVVLISGTAGTMKSSVVLNMFYNEVLLNKSIAVYLSLEQSSASLLSLCILIFPSASLLSLWESRPFRAGVGNPVCQKNHVYQSPNCPTRSLARPTSPRGVKKCRGANIFVNSPYHPLTSSPPHLVTPSPRHLVIAFST